MSLKQHPTLTGPPPLRLYQCPIPGCRQGRLSTYVPKCPTHEHLMRRVPEAGR